MGAIHVPACWDQLRTMLERLGMVESKRYRVCMGLESTTHAPILYEPSAEDNYMGNVIYCTCYNGSRTGSKLKRDCTSCCEKCTKCPMPRKQMLSFDYIPIGKQLQLLSKSRSLCHEFYEPCYSPHNPSITNNSCKFGQHGMFHRG